MKLVYLLLPLALLFSVLPHKKKDIPSVALWGAALLIAIFTFVINMKTPVKVHI